MSKLIVEMEMPRNCDECEVNYDCAFCGITGSAFYGNTRVPNFMPDEQKLPDCPISGVLPEQHGDLIDRDHFKENLDMVCDAGGWLEPITQAVRVYCKKQVDAEKTIVPATERSET